MSNKKFNNNRNTRNRNERSDSQSNNKPIENKNSAAALIRDASNVFFSNSLGVEFDLLGKPTVIPGILTIASTVNLSNHRTDVVTHAARQIYTWVRHANSGKTNYEAPDLMMALVGISTLFGKWEEARRAYRVATKYSMDNRYFGRSLLRALGYQLNDLSLADFRYRLNLIAHKLNSFAVPTNFQFVDTITSEYKDVFLDEANVKAQLIARTNPIIFNFDPTHDNGSALQPVNLKQYVNAKQHLDMLEVAIDTFMVNEDINIMSGDLFKTYGSSGLYKLDPISLDEAMEFTYDPLFLEQLQNADILNDVPSGIIYQANGGIFHMNRVAEPDFVNFNLLKNGNRLINTTSDDITPELIFLLSKYKIDWTSYDDHGIDYLEVVSGGTTILSNATVYTNTLTSTGISATQISQIYTNASTAGTTSIRLLSKFKKHFYIWHRSGSTILPLPVGDMDNYGLLSNQNVIRMNEARFIMNFETPQIGTTSVRK